MSCNFYKLVVRRLDDRCHKYDTKDGDISRIHVVFGIVDTASAHPLFLVPQTEKDHQDKAKDGDGCGDDEDQFPGAKSHDRATFRI